MAMRGENKNATRPAGLSLPLVSLDRLGLFLFFSYVCVCVSRDASGGNTDTREHLRRSLDKTQANIN